MQFPSRADRAFERFRESGDPRALARCFDLTARELARVARHLTRDPHRAEDLLQATYLAAMEQRAEFQPGERVLPWLLGILANRARAARKSAARRPDPHRTAEPSGEPDPLDAAAEHETSDTLRAVLLAFPSPYREVVTLHVLHGMSAREIGEALGVPAGTVRTQLVRGLERLRRRLPAGIALRAWLFPLALPRLGAVREAVLARAGVELPAGLGAALLGGVLTMKAIVALLGVAFLAGAGWWLWPGGDGETGAPLVSAAEPGLMEDPAPPAAELRLPELPEGTSAPRASLPLAREPMLVVSVTRSGGEPAAGARVRLIQASDDGNPELHERSVVTGADGVARVDELPDGRWFACSDRCGAVREVTLVVGESVRVELVLPPGVHVSGRVVDERDRARPGAGIWLSAEVGAPDRGLVVSVADAEGRFELHDVEPGRWIAARAEGCLDSFCAPLDRAPGDTLELVLELATGGGRLHGRVVDGAGSPVARAAVMAGYNRVPMRRGRLQPERPGMRGWTDEDGRFELWGPVGRTPLWVRAAGFAPWTATVECKIDADELSVALSRGAVVRGRIRDEDGAPVAREWVEVFHFALEPGAGIAFGGPDWGRPLAKTDEAGEFVVRELPAGRVRLTLERHGWIARTELELVEGEERLWEATLVAPGPAGSIEGFVRDSSGAPLEGWTVWARTDVQGARAPGNGKTDARGAFALEPCDDEAYQLGLRGPGSLMSRGDHQLAGVRPGGGPIEIVVPDEHRASAAFSGLVRDADGPVTEGLQVFLRRVAGFDGLGSASGATRFEGERFFLESVLPGRYSVHVGRGYAGGVELGEFEVGPGETRDLGTIEIPEPGSVVLEVLDAAGEPLTEARLVLRQGLGSSHGGLVTVTGGRGTSRPLSAGTYQLQPFGGRTPLFCQPVEVLPNETTTVTLRLPHAVSRRLRYPPMERDTFVRETWTDGSGQVLSDGLPTYPSPTGYEREVFLVPDTYTIELTFEGTPPQRLTLTVEDREDPGTIELPDPRR